jgi:hypothetical protein
MKRGSRKYYANKKFIQLVLFCKCDRVVEVHNRHYMYLVGGDKRCAYNFGDTRLGKRLTGSSSIKDCR